MSSGRLSASSGAENHSGPLTLASAPALPCCQASPQFIAWFFYEAAPSRCFPLKGGQEMTSNSIHLGVISILTGSLVQVLALSPGQCLAYRHHQVCLAIILLQVFCRSRDTSVSCPSTWPCGRRQCNRGSWK